MSPIGPQLLMNGVCSNKESKGWHHSFWWSFTALQRGNIPKFIGPLVLRIFSAVYFICRLFFMDFIWRVKLILYLTVVEHFFSTQTLRNALQSSEMSTFSKHGEAMAPDLRASRGGLQYLTQSLFGPHRRLWIWQTVVVYDDLTKVTETSASA